MKQQTLKNPITVSGIGLHSGCQVKLVLKPAPADTGIIFKRIDLADQPEIKALYNNVVDTRNCTCLGDKKGNLVSTIEHLMATLRVCHIDNVLIETDNQEIPIMDGSAKPFWEILSEVELLEQNAPRKILRIKQKVSFQDDKGNMVSLAPVEGNKLNLNFNIEFPSPIVGHQVFQADLTPEIFASQIAPSRTFCEKFQVDYLRSIGLAKGGSLENAVVLDGDKILNEGGFRVKNECVNHKVLDAIGDLYTAGFVIYGRYQADKTGHYHNNELLKLVFADSANYQIG
ncbi:MAG: UDP-3-O-[Alphaproteobacteria bacterium]|nr:UDP-3-O-[3-hydroxymyristoyl] N-acetylglucosamine deacetylase [Alphaproteobacteria bacterium]